MNLRRPGAWTLLFVATAFMVCADPPNTEEQADLIFKSQDANKDGDITLEEVKVVIGAYVKLLMDAEGDQEKVEAANKKYAYALNLEMFFKADGNDDHKVDRKDVLNFIETIRTPNEPKLSSKDCDEMGPLTIEFEWDYLARQGDADKDGKFSKAEWLGPSPSEKEEEEFDLCDADKDGKLTRPEAARLHTRRLRVAHGYPADSKDDEGEEEEEE